MSTLIIYAGNENFYNSIQSSSATYSTARAGTGTIALASTLLVGQQKYTDYIDWEAFCWWDTSPLTAAAIISAVVPAFYGYSNYVGATGWTCNLRLHDFGDTVQTTDWVGGASLSGKALLAHVAVTSTTPTNAYTNFTEDYCSSNINKTGHTRALMSSSRHEAGNVPGASTNEHMEWYPPDASNASPEPKLTITYTLPTPTVTSLSVTSGPQSGGTSVVITGTNFIGAEGITFEQNGNWSAPATTFHVDSATQITCTSPAGNAADTVDIRVLTSAGWSATGAGDHFTFVALPVVTGVSPSSGPMVGGPTVTITGTGFTGASAVVFGAYSPTSWGVDSDTQIRCYSGVVGGAATPGTVDVRVTTVGGQSATGAGDHYTFLNPSTVRPNNGPWVAGCLYGQMTSRRSRREKGW